VREMEDGRKNKNKNKNVLIMGERKDKQNW
jgi:hypothetical protein